MIRSFSHRRIQLNRNTLLRGGRVSALLDQSEPSAWVEPVPTDVEANEPMQLGLHVLGVLNRFLGAPDVSDAGTPWLGRVVLSIGWTLTGLPLRRIGE